MVVAFGWLPWHFKSHTFFIKSSLGASIKIYLIIGGRKLIIGPFLPYHI